MLADPADAAACVIEGNDWLVMDGTVLLLIDGNAVDATAAAGGLTGGAVADCAAATCAAVTPDAAQAAAASAATCEAGTPDEVDSLTTDDMLSVGCALFASAAFKRP